MEASAVEIVSRALLASFTKELGAAAEKLACSPRDDFVNDEFPWMVEWRRLEHRFFRTIEHLPNIRSFVINLIQQKR